MLQYKESMDSPLILTNGTRLLDSDEQRFLIEFIKALDEADLQCLFLRNYEKFPDYIGHDLDLFFQKNDVDSARKIFLSTLECSGGTVIHHLRMEYVESIWFRVAPTSMHWLHLDFFPGACSWRGLKYLGDEELLNTHTQFNNLPVPRPAHEALSLLMATLLAAGYYKARYQDRINGLLVHEAELTEFKKCISHAFGRNALYSYENSPPPGDRKWWSQYARQLRRALIRRSFFRNPLRSLIGVSRYWSHEFKSVIKPWGISIAILGANARARSSIASQLAELLGGSLFGECRIHSARPSILPDRFKHKICRGHSGISTSAALFHIGYCLMDFAIGYFPRVLWRTAHNYLVIFNDHTFLNRRYFPCGTAGFIVAFQRILRAFVPQPDLIYWMKDGPPSPGSDGDLEPHDVCIRAKVIDCTKGIEHAVNEISRDLLDILHKRCKQQENL